MTATLAPSPWPAPAGPPAAGRRFGFEARPDGGSSWTMRRNCSLSPRQLAQGYLVLCVVSASVGAGFWFHGVPWVMAFTGLELAAVALALLVHARHVGDGESITLAAGQLLLEHRCGGRVERTAFRAAWLRVEPACGQGSLVALSGDGREARIGRYVRPEWRSVLAEDLRRALRASSASDTGMETK